jgi:chemotaxis protein methyltransferase CheR
MRNVDWIVIVPTVGHHFCVRPQHREGIEFLDQDLRTEAPKPLFDLILCRFVAFTYFAPPLQEQVLNRIVDQLLSGGYLAIGTHERLPTDSSGLLPLARAPQIFEKRLVSQLRMA